MEILVVDAQGGGIGKQLVTEIKKRIPNAEIIAVGTNSAATQAMLKAGADHAATGENAVVVASRTADIIVGPIGIVIADSMYGEITPTMAISIGQSPASKVLIPFQNCFNLIVGVEDIPTSDLIEKAIQKIIQLSNKKE